MKANNVYSVWTENLFKGEIHGHFKMTISKLTDVFEIHVHFKRSITKRQTSGTSSDKEWYNE